MGLPRWLLFVVLGSSSYVTVTDLWLWICVHVCLWRGIRWLFDLLMHSHIYFKLSLKTCYRLLQNVTEGKCGHIYQCHKQKQLTHKIFSWHLCHPNTHARPQIHSDSHRLFKVVPLLQGECVGLGDDGDDVDHLAETPHELHIQRPQTGGGERWQLQ